MKYKIPFTMLMGVLILGGLVFSNIQPRPAAVSAAELQDCESNALVIFDQPLADGFSALEASGGCVVHFLPPHAVIGYLPEELQALPGASVYRDAVDPAMLAQYGAEAELAAHAWNSNHVQPPQPVEISPQAQPLAGEVMRLDPELLPERPAAIDAAPGYYDMSGFMAGRVAVGIVLPESNGAQDPSTENWDASRMNTVVAEIQQGLNWWAGHNPGGNLQFVYDIHPQVPTRFEPINRNLSDHHYWISETLAGLGFNGSYWYQQSYAYLNNLRTTQQADWAVLIFVVDSLHDANGMFPDNFFAYSYHMPPVVVMTYDNDGWSIGNMDSVTAHEVAHNFGAGDEYGSCNCSELFGYLAIPNSNCHECATVDCIMLTGSVTSGACEVSRHQVGMRDTDGDGKPDPVDTFPAFTVTSQPPDCTPASIVSYAGSIRDVPWDSPTGPEFTINKITTVQYSLDGGAWLPAVAGDGVFDEVDEDFRLSIAGLSVGDHQVRIRASNRWGNSTLWTDTFTRIDGLNLFLPVLVR